MTNRRALSDPALCGGPGGPGPQFPADPATALLDDLAVALNRCKDGGVPVSAWNGILATPMAYVICIDERWMVRFRTSA